MCACGICGFAVIEAGLVGSPKRHGPGFSVRPLPLRFQAPTTPLPYSSALVSTICCSKPTGGGLIVLWLLSATK